MLLGNELRLVVTPIGKYFTVQALDDPAVVKSYKLGVMDLLRGNGVFRHGVWCVKLTEPSALMFKRVDECKWRHFCMGNGKYAIVMFDGCFQIRKA